MAKKTDGATVPADFDLTADRLLEGSPFLVLIVDRSGRIRHGNQAACRALGYSIEELTRLDISAIDPGPREEAWTSRWDSLLQRRTTISEGSYRRKDGSVLSAEVRAGVTDLPGIGSCLVAFIMDISGRKAEEADATRIQHRFRDLFEDLQVGIFRTDIGGTGKWLEANRVLLELLEVPSLEALQARSIREFYLSADDCERVLEVLRTRGRISNHELHWRTASGHERWFLLSGLMREEDENRYFEGTLMDVTDRKAAESELKRLATFSEENPNPIVEVDKDGSIVYANSASETRVSDLRSRPAGAFTAGLVENWEAIRAGRLSERIVEVEGRWFLQNLIHVAISGRVRVYAIDITARHKAEEADREALSRFQELVSNLVVGVYRNTPGPKGHFLEANEAIVKMFEAGTKEEFLKHNVSELYQDPSKRLEFSRKMEQQGYLRGEELALVTLKGRPFWAAISAVMKKDKDGNPYFDGVIEDITERKAVAAVVNAQRDLIVMLNGVHDLKAAARTCLAVAIAGTGFDCGGIYLFAERTGRLELVESSGLTPEFVRSVSGYAPELPGLKALAKGAISLSSSEVRDFVDDDAIRKEGIKTLLSIPIFSRGKLIGALNAGSHQTRLQTAFVQGVLETVASQFADTMTRLAAENQVAELDQLRDKLVQIVSQQLRTPLNSIRWNLEALLANEVGKLSEAQHEFVRIVHNAEVEVMRRFRQMLMVIDIREGRAQAVKDSASFEAIWMSVMSGIVQRAAIKEIEFKYEPPAQALPPLVVDVDRVRDAMSAVAMNAIEYTPARGRVVVRITPVEDRVRFEVSDTGIGVPVNEKTRIFDAFYRATNAALMVPEASGLGLTIAKHCIEQHGGTFGCESEEGKGSVFWFELPIG